MHELAAVDALVDAIVLSVAEHQPCRVEVVRVRRGSTFCEEALRQGFEMLTRGTPLEGARLEVDAIDEGVACRCGLQQVMQAQDLIGGVWICPNCGHTEESGELDDLTLLNVALVPLDAPVGTGGR
jgi:Zn finger protein HypA/HybF involved in hydrogenase expression